MVDIKYKMNWVPQAKELRDRLTAKENVGIASKIDEDTDDDFYQNMYEALSKYFSSDEDADKVLIPEETDRDAISTEVIKSYDDIMKYYGKTGMLSREGVDVEVDKVLGDPRMLEIPTKTFDDTEEVLSVEEVSDIASDAIDSTSNADEVQPTDGKAFEFNKKLVDDLRVLEGLDGDTLTGIPTYSYGITEEKANEYGLKPSQFNTMKEFALAFSDKYVKEKKAANKEIFSTVDEKHHLSLMSYLWNTGAFGPRQKEALKQNDMNEFISEMRDAIHTQGKSSSGLSMRRAKEANMIGENLDDWTPIHKVVVSGTRASPTFEWQTESGEIVETYTSDRSLHSGNITDKPNQTDTLNEEIIL